MEAVILDLFGTLVYRQVKLNFTRGLGLPKDAAATMMSGEFPTVHSLCKHLRVNPEQRQLAESEGLLASDVERTFEYHDAVSSIEWMRGRGMRVFVLSNLATPWAKKVKAMKFFDLVEKAYLSCETGRMKPDPASYAQILSENRLDPAKTLFVGDTIADDIIGPWSCGIRSALRGPSIVATVEAAMERVGNPCDFFERSGAEFTDTRFGVTYVLPTAAMAKLAMESASVDPKVLDGIQSKKCRSHK